MLKLSCVKSALWALLLSLALPVSHAAEIAVPAQQAVKELGTTCKKLPQAKNACVIAFFDESEDGETLAFSSKKYTHYRVLQGKNKAGYYVIQDFYRSGVKGTDTIQTKNAREIKSLSYAGDLNIDGALKTWYENGQQEFVGNFKSGKLEGVVVKWYDNGQKSYQSTYRNGNRNGMETSWSQGGRKRYEATFKDDKLDGLQTEWYANGQKKSEEVFKNGEAIGTPQYWNRKGEPVKFLETW